MKKLIFLLIIIITLTNVSFASFPVTMEYVISIDTIKPDTNKIVIKETTAEFHSRLEKEGFDVDNCQCKDCRRFKGSDIKERERRRKCTQTRRSTTKNRNRHKCETNVSLVSPAYAGNRRTGRTFLFGFRPALKPPATRHRPARARETR